MNAFSREESSIFHKTLVIDIETVPVVKDWNTLTKALQTHWLKKMEHLILPEEEKAAADFCFENRAGVYSEFGKVICIGLGLFTTDNKGQMTIRQKALFNHDEKKLLTEFGETISAFQNVQKDMVFCGHNIKEFDIPFLCRRFLINGLPVPNVMQFAGLKPWQVPMEDTLHLWRFGDYKHYTSLDLLAAVLDVPSSKTDMDGSQVGPAYWKENKLKEIADYCLQDIYTTSLVYLKLKGYKGNPPTFERVS